MSELARPAAAWKIRRARWGSWTASLAGTLLVAAAAPGSMPAGAAGDLEAPATAGQRPKPKPERSRGDAAGTPAGAAAERQGAAEREGSSPAGGAAAEGRRGAADRGGGARSSEGAASGGVSADARGAAAERRGTAAGELPDEIAAKLPAPSAEQQQNLAALQGDLSAIGSGLQDAEEEIRQLASDLKGVSAHAPDPALVEQLARDLQAALADSTLSPREAAELSQSVYAVLNSAGLSQQELAMLKSDVEAILAASGVGREEIEAVMNDLQAIYDAYQGPSADPAGSRRTAPAPATEPAKRLRDRRP